MRTLLNVRRHSLEAAVLWAHRSSFPYERGGKPRHGGYEYERRLVSATAETGRAKAARKEEWQSLNESRRAAQEFTVARAHALFQGLSAPAPSSTRYWPVTG